MRLSRIVCTLGALLAAGPILAATFTTQGMASPAVALVGQEVTFAFPVAYFKNEKTPCGIKVQFGDTSPPQWLPDNVQQSQYPNVYSFKHVYNRASTDQPYGGIYIATVVPEAHGATAACSGNGNTAKVTVNAPVVLSPGLKQALAPQVVSSAAVIAAVTIPVPVATVTGVSFPANWLDAANGTIQVDTNGNKGAACGVLLELAQIEGGLTKQVPLDHVNYPTTTSYKFSWPNAPAGTYKVAVKPLPASSTLTGPGGGPLPTCAIAGSVGVASVVLQVIKKDAALTVGAAPPIAGPAMNPALLIDTTPTTGVALQGEMARAVFPAGVAQTFKLTSSTGGKNCHFSVEMSNGNGVTFSHVYDAPLPWTSPDFAQGNNAPGQQYAITVKAVAPTKPGPSACQGVANLNYRVVYEIGSITSVTLAPKSVATGQKVDWAVNGKSFGYCDYMVSTGTRGAPADNSYHAQQLPNHFSMSYDKPGQYFVNADETIQGGNPVGCAGHAKSDFVTVLPRPTCPAPQYAYKSPDDSDYGCVFPASVQPTITETFSCPVGYSAQKSILQDVQYGCHRDSAPKTLITTAILGASAISVASGSGATSGSPKLDTPTITKVQLVAASGGLPRPNSNVFYSGEDLQVDISGNVTNNGGWNIFKCGYEVQLENISTNHTDSYFFTNFTIHSLGANHPPGEYRVKAVPKTTLEALACAGSASTGTFHLDRRAAWLTDLKLKGFGYHFNMADDMAMPQFCENCTSIFSPAHNSAFLMTTPVFADGGPACAYSITQNGNVTPEVYANGKVIPTGQEQQPPFMTKWGNSNTVTVTVKGLEGLSVPACNGSVTKTISFTDNPNLPPVYK